jgi:putative transposase
VRCSDRELKACAEWGMRLVKKALEEVASLVKPNTILAWHQKLTAQTCDGSKPREPFGRPKLEREPEAMVMRMAQAHHFWGDDRNAHALQH